MRICTYADITRCITYLSRATSHAIIAQRYVRTDVCKNHPLYGVLRGLAIICLDCSQHLENS
jgi:hypothetical protein